MKKYFFLILLSIFLLFPAGASALTLENGLEITEDNLRYYFDEVIYYQDSNFYANYKYCLEENNSSATTIKYYCFDEDNKNKITRLYFRSSSMYYQLNSSGLQYKGVSFNKSDFTYTIYQPLNTVPSPLWNIRYFNFDYIDSNGVVLESNWESIIESNYFTVKFDIPSNVNLIVKDCNGEEIVSSDNNVYSLKSGDYIYIIKSELYETLEETFVVSEDITIKPKLVSKLDLGIYNDLFSNFYLVLNDFSSKIFNLENPLFLIGVSFIIFIALILLIKKLLGGS